MLQTMFYLIFFFFFQAEDGIRDLTVTGVQTCALPIFRETREMAPLVRDDKPAFDRKEIALDEGFEEKRIRHTRNAGGTEIQIKNRVLRTRGNCRARRAQFFRRAREGRGERRVDDA